MSSAEVYGWGDLSAVSREEYPAPLEIARSKPARKVFAGSGRAILSGYDHATWLRARTSVGDDVDIKAEAGDDPWTIAVLEGAAFGQSHTLLLVKTAAGNEPSNNAAATSRSETRVLALGSGREGQLGLGSKTLETARSQTIQALRAYHVVQLACGAHHSAAVTSDGDLFTWGRGIEGQLGHASHHLPPELNDAISSVQFRPKPVSAFLATKKRSRPVAAVSCGHNFTVVVTRAGGVWTFGEGAMGQLGIGRVTQVMVPTLVMEACPVTGDPVVEVAAGWAHVLARNQRGGLLSWGFNALGSLGLGDHRTRFFPENITFGGVEAGGGDGHDDTGTIMGSAVTVAKIHAHGNRSGALTLRGELFTWGCDIAGSLGHGCDHERRRSKLEEQVCMSSPRRVERLARSVVTDFALSARGGIALVPLRVKSIQPASGPLEGGCRIVVGGDGFWDSPDIVVKFTPTGRQHKPLAARSAIGTYVACNDGSGDKEDCRNGINRVVCTAPRFASPEEVFVEVSIDGRSFSRDGNRFQYYQTPEIKEITPNQSRPPWPRLRLDGDNIRPSDSMVVRFEEELEMDIRAEGTTSVDNNEISFPALHSPRIFEIHATTESEVTLGEIDPETDLPIKKERWFITCEAPSLGDGAKFPFICRVTVAPNGVTFRGNPVRFTANDSFVDACAPTAAPLPISVPATAEGDGEGFQEKSASVIHITGRNLYHSAGLTVRLRSAGRGRDERSVNVDDVTFDRRLKIITGTVPAAAGELEVQEASSVGKETPQGTAISVVVEVSMDGTEFLAVPEMLILYRNPRLTLIGDGLFLASRGGLAQLAPDSPAFRGHNPKVRLRSDLHGLDITLDLLSSPPPPETEFSNELSAGTPTKGGGGQAEVSPPPLSGSKNIEVLAAQEAEQDAARANVDAVERENCRNAMLDKVDSKAVTPPVSAESFFFLVPPFPKGDGKPRVGDPPPGGLTYLEGVNAPPTFGDSISTPGVKPSSAKTLREEVKGDAQKEPPQEWKVSLTVFVSLNGVDWRQACGPLLTYFQPPPEPVKPKPSGPKRRKK